MIFITTDESLGVELQFDIGAVAQTIALVATDYGLGTCIQGQGVFYPSVIRALAEIPESEKIAICVTIGYPDWDFPANQVMSEREAVDNIVNWRP